MMYIGTFISINMVLLITALCIVVHCYSAVIDYSTESNDLKNFSEQSLNQKVFIKTTLLEIEEKEFQPGTNVVKTRFKRQQSSGAGKFTEAATMPQIKALRLFLTMFKNLWAASYVGGAHPFHHNVPKPIVQLYKEKIVQFFFPDVGEEAAKTG